MTSDQILEQARKQFASDAEWERELRDEYKEDRRFEVGLQWPPGKAEERIAVGRPAIVDNPLPMYVQQLTNEIRQNRPSLGFTPVEDADEEMTKLLEGMARHIQYDSEASTAYEGANHCQVAGSFGFFRMVSQYANNENGNQELKIREIVDPLSVYGVLRPAILRQKCRHAFVIETITREEHERLYGESAAFTSFAAKDITGWVSKDEVRIAEYWWIETKKKTRVGLPDGTWMDADLVPPDVKNAITVAAALSGEEPKTRVVDVDTVRWCKMNGAEILPDTETVCVGSSIWIYAVLGEQVIIEGKPVLLSLLRFTRSPCQLINYGKSRIAEALMAPAVSGWKGPEGIFEGHEREWDEAFVRPRARMEYKVVTVDGKSVGEPHRDTFEPPIMSLSAFVAQEIDSRKANSSMYDAQMGAQSNETSMVAIRERRMQSSGSNFHYGANLGRAQTQCGRDLAEALWLIYDGMQLVRILGEDETRGSEWINKAGPDGKIKHDISAASAGKYDVVVKIGKAYSTKRLETFDTLAQLVQGNPGLLPTIGDIVFRNSDMAGADQIAERFKKMLPPQLAEDDADKKAPADPKMQAQLQALDRQNQQLTAALNQAQDEIDAKTAELVNRKSIAELQEETKRILGLAKIDSAEGIELLRQEIAQLSSKIDRDYQAGESEAGRRHTTDQAQADREHQVSQGEADRRAQEQQAQQRAQQERRPAGAKPAAQE